jgi:CubicO group peptidase (beta-lactamase class C family)
MINQNEFIHSQWREGRTDISPEAAGFNPAKLNQLDAFLGDLVQRQKLQCASYLLSRNGKIFAAKSAGNLTYHADSGEFMPDSIRWIASITKSITAIAIMKLIEDGKIYLGQPVMTILEELDTPVHSGIQIYHLLTHTSGIRADSGYFCEPYPADEEDIIQSGQNWIKKTLEGPLQAEIGTAWNYSGSNYRLLGEIIARVSGMSYEDYVMKSILEPLNMKDTFFRIPQNRCHEVCFIREWEESAFLSTDDSYPISFSAGGGLFSSLYDLWKLGQMILNQGCFNGVQVLGRKTVEAMNRNCLTGIPAYWWGSKIREMKFGLGWYLSTQDLATPGTISNEGYGRSAFYIDLVEQFIAVYFVPTTTDWFAESMVNPRAFMWSGLR